MLCARFSRFSAVLAMSGIICAGCLSVDCFAAYSGGEYVDPGSFRDMLGTDLTYQYFDGSSYQNAHFVYVGTFSDGFYFRDGVMSNANGQPYLLYKSSGVSVVSNPAAITVKINCDFSLLDTDFIYTYCAISSNYFIPTSVYNSSVWEWNISGDSRNFVSPASYHSGRQDMYNNCYFRTDTNTGILACGIPVSISSDSSLSAYAGEAKFYGSTQYDSGDLYFMVGIPYVSADASVIGGTLPAVTTAPAGSGDINVTVDVDMGETNGLLGDIKEGIAGLANTILDGIKGLFVPDDDFMTGFKEDMEDLLQEHLGGLYEAEQIVENFVEELPDVTEKESIYIPACNIPLAGTTFVLGDWTVPLKVTGMPAILYNSIAFIIDFLATTAFITMCRRKLEIFLNPDSEVINE